MSYISNLRKYVGHMPIMATAVSGIIYDKDKGILLEKRTDNGMWCVPGGSIELEESLDEALKREVKEETNLDIDNYKIFDVKSDCHMIYPNGDEVYYTEIVYVILGYNGELGHDNESSELKWFNDELPNIMDTQQEYVYKFINNIDKFIE